VESKFQKQLAEKDAELKDLMNEGWLSNSFSNVNALFPGNKLSTQNAKQAKELKRLRELEKEHETVSGMLTDATDEVNRLTEMEGQLKSEFIQQFFKLYRCLDNLRKMQALLTEKEAEIASIREKVHHRQEMADDLQTSEQRCQNQKLQIAKLEQRIDELMIAQRASAEQIAECRF
jgi:chromosome segregation ATPase